MMTLALNGYMSSSPGTKHIKSQYYFVKDKVKEGEVDIRYCLTKQIWSDVLNKPNQGAPFRKDRAMLMNVPIDYDDGAEFLKTNPGLIPKDKSEGLGALGISGFDTPSRSVLGDISNQNIPGNLRNETTLGVSGNGVRWSEVVSQRG